MIKFIRALGEKIQRLFFGKKKQYDSFNGLQKNHVSNSIFYIDDEPVGRTPEEYDKAFAAIENMDLSLELELTMDKKELENLAKIRPKHYWCKTLIFTIAANQPYEYQSMDISQLEGRGIAHFVIGRTVGFQEMEEEYRRQEKENEDGIEWLREGAETGLCSIIYGSADLYYYEELGYWDFD